MTRRPIIGVTTSEVRRKEHTDPLPQSDPPQNEMALGMTYARAVERAGGLPVVLPPLPNDAVEPLLLGLDGICLSGGPDIDPIAYHADPHPELGETEPQLDVFELTVARTADRLGLPVLGICRGAQALNVARGGTLHQHLPDVVSDELEHRQSAPGREPTHMVRVEDDSRLAEIMGAGREAAVNSFHHQGVDVLGEGLRAVAWAPDGTVEGIEDDTVGHLFLGVQWHAETLIERPEHLALFEALVAEAAARRARSADAELDPA
ncbi:gamma-glutamyl-gamma-aminobutyrate hydrolase family protein [Conexibacter sp. SYSU D00693]|uniref:gamma-glutamyl-gamma-aminobutyrate hydrolase family protein n=1 Tax=Conexibacter sp. SYSU D00693 TaxID=2812560 RepID=UPI00196BA67C|nr:gamma-glutamyl-gamma-aminobutyrate hydrolase family protein [Conexibacter sp. SYSU D00693]